VIYLYHFYFFKEVKIIEIKKGKLVLAKIRFMQ
jgi:hypothetical protein